MLVDPIIHSSTSLIPSTNTLWRVNQLNFSIHPLKIYRDKVIRKIEEIRDVCLEGDLDQRKIAITQYLNEIKEGLRENQNITQIYASEIDSASSCEELSKFINLLLADLKTLSTFSLKKASRGQFGPTHIISYKRRSATPLKNRDYVIKWTNWNEICTSRLLALFAEHLNSFRIPKLAVLDLENQIHETGNGLRSELPLKDITNLKKKFADTVGKSNFPQDTKLVFMEKVSGSNLVDFAKTEYAKLHEKQKQDLFKKMGMIAMIDLILGNTDRLIQTAYAAQEYSLDNQSANFGNLMISWTGAVDEMPILYTIDSGINSDLISNTERKKSYKRFLQIYLNENSIPDLAKSIAASMEKSLEDYANLETENKMPLNIAREKFHCLQEDLNNPEIFQQPLEKGLKTMLSELKKNLSHFWSGSIQEYLKKNQPEMFETLSEQLNILK